MTRGEQLIKEIKIAEKDIMAQLDGRLQALMEELATLPEGEEYFNSIREEQERLYEERGKRIYESASSYPEA